MLVFQNNGSNASGNDVPLRENVQQSCLGPGCPPLPCQAQSPPVSGTWCWNLPPQPQDLQLAQSTHEWWLIVVIWVVEKFWQGKKGFGTGFGDVTCSAHVSHCQKSCPQLPSPCLCFIPCLGLVPAEVPEVCCALFFVWHAFSKGHVFAIVHVTHNGFQTAFSFCRTDLPLKHCRS